MRPGLPVLCSEVAEESGGSTTKEDRGNDLRYLTSLLFVCLIGVVPAVVAAGLVMALLGPSHSSVSPTANSTFIPPRVCTTNDCKQLAQWLRVQVQQKVDPCHDFYGFVCNDYEGTLPMLKLKAEIIRMSISAALVATVPATGQTAWQKATALFKACLTMFDTGRDETDDLIAWMTSLGLDLNNLTPSDPFDVVDMLVRFSLDFNIPVYIHLKLDPQTVVDNKRLLSLVPNIAEWKWYDSPERTKAFCVALLQTYGVNSTRAQDLADEIKSFENVYKRATYFALRIEKPAIVTGQIQDIGAATQPTITTEKWIGSISKYTNNTYQGHDTITYANFVPLTLANALEFEYLGPQGMRCLIAWALFRRLVMITDPDRRTTNGDPETSCYKNTTSVMGLALTSRFLYSVISNKTIVEADEMTTNIRKAYQAAMQSSSWMTGCVRNTAVRKLGNIRQHIGGLGNFQDGAYVEKYYASFPDVSTDRFFNAWREAAAAAIHQAWADPTMTLEVDMESEVNGFYYPTDNEIYIPAPTLLQNIFFTEGPPAFNYGSFGTIVGHELMHAYDVNRSEYDENGQRRGWFSPEAAKRYENNTLCLRHSIRTVDLARQEVLNDTADSENLADFVGTMMSYSAFSSLPSSKRDITLPGVAMTANQLFFVGLCTRWCEERKETNPRYASGRARCIVPLMNMVEFTDAFRCKQGSRMNPQKKCSFWT